MELNTYHANIEGEGYIYAFKRAKKSDDLAAIKKSLKSDPFGFADFAVQGPGMEATITITNGDGEEIMNDIVDACNFNESIHDEKVPSDLAEDEVLVTYVKPAPGLYVDQDFDVTGELDETGTLDDMGVGGTYIEDITSNGAYVFTKMGFSDEDFEMLPVESEAGPQIRIKDSAGESFFVTDENHKKFYPMDSELEELIDRNHDALYPDEDDEDIDTCNAEDDVISFIGNLDLEFLEEVEDKDADGLYVDPDDDSCYELVKNGRTLLGFC